MIFLTIGTQEPFDRLIKAVDEIAEIIDRPIIAQVAKTSYVVKNMQAHEFVSPTEFNSYFNQAKLIISHAGMGTIITALEKEKPIIVLPRIAKLGEHRNDHQLATAKSFDKLKYIHVAYNEHQLKDKLLSLLNEDLKPLHKIGKFASKELLNSIQSFIES
ncbi:PssE/Cps14G family polysaccharide biosynthesis glycosyltransferase [Solitalea lacus]|uniref:PssE/Cps14G family polysaccharide biosynthesis glycosyltransferase n=1 Tax=Solitalea lacus TaxID=2911172 RepID=UPI001EDA0CA4|nr:PssE/Cps14G family polysaccharide biosynthesis glycosyltransferase [Solitalea lacus]UKJ07067.1 glycosyl transferase family 28 [Solitalea lacus]